MPACLLAGLLAADPAPRQPASQGCIWAGELQDARHASQIHTTVVLLHAHWPSARQALSERTCICYQQSAQTDCFQGSFQGVHRSGGACRYERGAQWQGVGKFPPWVLVKWVYTALCLNYSAAAFLVRKFLSLHAENGLVAQQIRGANCGEHEDPMHVSHDACVQQAMCLALAVPR